MMRDDTPLASPQKTSADHLSKQQDKTQVRARYDALAHKYIRHYRRPKSLFAHEKQRRAKVLEDYLTIIQPATILDIGCGPGYVASSAAECLPQAEIVGIDFSEAMIDYAGANYGEKASFLKGDIEHLPFSSGQFDFVYALGVLDKFKSPEYVLLEAHRVLSPRGMFLFTYLNNHSGSTWMLRAIRYLRQGKQANSNRFLYYSNTLVTCLQQIGFKIEQKHYITYGNGVVTWPWTGVMNLGLEKLLKHRELGCLLAMTTVWVAQKVGEASDE